MIQLEVGARCVVRSCVRRSVRIVVTIGVNTGAGGASVVAAGSWDGWLSLILVVCESSSWCTDGSTSFVRWAEICMVSMVSSSEATGTNSTKFSVLLVSSVGSHWASLASEPFVSAAFGVVVGWRWAVALLLLVMTRKPKLHDSADEKEECSDDGDCEDNLVQLASETNARSIRDILAIASSESVLTKAAVSASITTSERAVDIAAIALLSTVSSHYSDSNETSSE